MIFGKKGSDFYPRSPCGERPGRAETAITLMGFLSTLSLRRATTKQTNLPSKNQYFYPRSPCGERPDDNGVQGYRTLISIHALLAESDLKDSAPALLPAAFLSTLSLRRATLASIFVHLHINVFLSTLSLRRATRRHRGNDRRPIHFYPRSPCGERPAKVGRSNQPIINFYPRSPCGERPTTIITICIAPRFLSTLSLRRATQTKRICRVKISISIHALLAESDLAYPDMIICTNVISIHALLAESDI